MTNSAFRFDRRWSIRATPLVLALVLGGCKTWPDKPDTPPVSASQARTLIGTLLPSGIKDRDGWTADIYAGFAAMELHPSADNICSVIAVTAQESGFADDPQVPGLSKIAWREIEDRAKRFHIPISVVRTALRVPSPGGKSFAARIDEARTEAELSSIYEDLISFLPLGKSLLSNRNPVRTGGPMQVSISFAQTHAEQYPYPYPLDHSLRREVFTRRGGMYFGIAHLLQYPANYEQVIFRYADFNAGRYASRNAAFQNAVTLTSGIPLEMDGDLIRYGSSSRNTSPGATELASRVLAKRLSMRESEIRRDLEKGLSLDFESSELYEKVFDLADEQEDIRVPRAIIPDIKLKSPKITRNLTTKWFAERVASRHKACMKRVQ